MFEQDVFNDNRRGSLKVCDQYDFKLVSNINQYLLTHRNNPYVN